MKEMLEKLAGKRPDEEDHDSHAHAKMQVLHELRNMAMDMMGDKVRDKMPHEMHGVEVMAPDKAGLQKGLDLAKAVSEDSEEADEEAIHPGIHKEVARMEGDQGPQLSGHGQPDRSHAMEPDADDEEGHLENPGEENDDDLYSDMHPDELDAQIKHLQSLHKAKMMKR